MFRDGIECAKVNFFAYSALLSLKAMKTVVGNDRFEVLGMGYMVGYRRKTYDKLQKTPKGEIAIRDRVFGLVWGNLTEEDIQKIANYESFCSQKKLVKRGIVVDGCCSVVESFLFL
jgi:S-adenosylmethionine hydrolase